MNAMKRYVNDIERNLRMDRPTRVRIMRDLGSDIQSRREAGATDEQMYTMMHKNPAYLIGLEEQ